MFFYKFPDQNNMSWKRIKAIMLHEFFITKRSLEVINDIIIFPLLSIIIFGFLTNYLSGTTGLIISKQVLIGMILWQGINMTEYSIAVGCLWDVWARNLTNIFISPISNLEYLIAYTISGCVKSLIVLLFGGIISFYFFGTNLLDLGIINLIIYFVNLAFFGFGFAIVILGLIFRFGTNVQALSWGLIAVLQPLMAVIYPVSILPKPLQMMAYLLPPTYVFEAARANVIDKGIQWQLILMAFFLNFIFIFLAITFFNFMFNQSKKTGQFARLEG